MDRETGDWRKASHSNGSGDCVEVAAPGRVLVRDTKQDGRGPVLAFSAQTWRAFAARIKTDRAVLTAHKQRTATLSASPAEGVAPCPGDRGGLSGTPRSTKRGTEGDRCGMPGHRIGVVTNVWGSRHHT